VCLGLYCTEKYKKLKVNDIVCLLLSHDNNKEGGNVLAEEKQKKESAEKPAKPPRTPRTTQSNENIVLIGKKPVMNYVVACLTFFNSGSKKVVVKARGRAISRAVDTVELLRRAFLKDVQLQGINISTEEVTRGEGQKANVSAVEITLTRP
jgi:DNA-binding protein